MKTKIEEIISELINNKVLFANFSKYNNGEGKTICLFVRCNDLFAPDFTEEIEISSFEELTELYQQFKKEPQYGVDLWCCEKRNLQPQKIIKNIWIKNGIWNEKLDKLRIHEL